MPESMDNKSYLHRSRCDFRESPSAQVQESKQSAQLLATEQEDKRKMKFSIS